MDTQAVTEQILGAWEELEEEQPDEVDEAAVVTEGVEEPDEDRDQEETPEESAEEEGEETEEEEEAEEEPGEEEEPDPEIQAFLAKYEGDVDAALRGAAELQRVLGRQGTEKAALSSRVAELEAELQQAQTFGLGANVFSPEQREWLEEAVSSGNPGAYVNGALQAGELQLAKALCTEWAREDPLQAMRAVQYIDGVEATMREPEPEGPIDTGILLDVLSQNFPDMRQHEASMVATLGKLGPSHPLVQDAQSSELERAARGIVGIYEIAKASSTGLRSAKDGIKKKQRDAATEARENAVVSSATTSPSTTEKPRAVRLGPGLTLEDLEAEFAAQ